LILAHSILYGLHANAYRSIFLGTEGRIGANTLEKISYNVQARRNIISFMNLSAIDHFIWFVYFLFFIIIFYFIFLVLRKIVPSKEFSASLESFRFLLSPSQVLEGSITLQPSPCWY
jgi:hypothetical protein